MDEKYATEFDVEYDYDVLGCKPIYIICLSGKDGCLAVGNTKKRECEIRENTLLEAKCKCLDIKINTQVSYNMANELNKELGVSKMEEAMPKYVYRFKR